MDSTSQALCFLEAVEQIHVAKHFLFISPIFQLIYIGIYNAQEQNKCPKCLPYYCITNRKKYFQKFLPILNYVLLWVGFFRKPINTWFTQHFNKIRGKAQVPWSSVFTQHLIGFIFKIMGLFEVISWKHFDIVAKFLDHKKQIMKYFI